MGTTSRSVRYSKQIAKRVKLIRSLPKPWIEQIFIDSGNSINDTIQDHHLIKKHHMIIYINSAITMFKVNYRNTRTRCEICSELTIKALDRRQWRRSGAFINFENISHQVNVRWE